MTYQKIVEEFENNPRDVHTVPKNRALPIWFHVAAVNGSIYVTPAERRRPSSKLSMPRKLQEKEYEEILELYQRRKQGEPVAKEAKMATQSQVYWYGIFYELDL